MHSDDVGQYRLRVLIGDLNYATLIEERWSIEFVDLENGKSILKLSKR